MGQSKADAAKRKRRAPYIYSAKHRPLTLDALVTDATCLTAVFDIAL